MPLVHSNYRPPFLFRNGHFSTIYAGAIRTVGGLAQKRERLTLPDGDFIDLDWSDASTPTQSVVILIHGLEGDAQRPYIVGSAKWLNQNGHDVCAVNLRGCSGEPNRYFRSYHSGVTEDLASIIAFIVEKKHYNEIRLMGYSLGGNLIMKYLGEAQEIPEAVKSAVAVSVPCDLKDACVQLLTKKNKIYALRFKKHLLAKLWLKHKQFPDDISKAEIKSIKTLKDFDDIYTSKAHGFKNALDYYAQCSCGQFLDAVRVPSLILNAKNDSFLGQKCYPVKQAEDNSSIHLEIPDFGGHVGFWGKQNINYSERRSVAFFKEF